MTPLFIGGMGTTEIILIIVCILLMFGGKKIPELMRGAGRGIREFKDAMNNPDGDKDTNTPSDTKSNTTTTPKEEQK